MMGRVTTLDELEWFVALAETEHMTQAAERLSVAQPTLSRALGRLERQVGAPLFDRVNRRLRLNPSGEIMLEHARRSLAELAAAKERPGQELRGVGLGAALLAAVEELRGADPQKVGRQHLRVGARDRELHALVGADGAAEDLAFAGVGAGALDEPVAVADGLGGEQDPLGVPAVDDVPETIIDGADDVVGRDA